MAADEAVLRVSPVQRGGPSPRLDSHPEAVPATPSTTLHETGFRDPPRYLTCINFGRADRI